MRRTGLAMVLAAGLLSLGAVSAAADTVVYEADGLVVSAELTQGGTEIAYHVENNSPCPVVVTEGVVVANDIMMETNGSADFLTNEVTYGSQLGKDGLEAVIWGMHVDAGASGDFSREVGEETLQRFGYASASTLQLGVRVQSIVSEDQVDDVYGETVAVADDGQWDGTWTEPQGEVIYDKDGIRVTCTGIDQVWDWAGEVDFGLVVENRTDMEVCLESHGYLEGVPTMNDTEIETPFCIIGTEPGSRAFGHLEMSLDGIERAEDVRSAYAQLLLADLTNIEEIAIVEFRYQA